MLNFFQIYCYAINCISIFLNSILLLLSRHKSIEAIQELRYFLSNISVSGILFACTLLVLQPQFVTRGSMTIRIPHGPIKFVSDKACRIVSSMNTVFYMYGMLSFPLFFIYRSMILSNSTTFGQYFNRRNLLVTFIVIFIFCCIHGGVLYFANIPYDDLFDRLNRTSDYLLVLGHKNPVQSEAYATTPPSAQNISGVAAQPDEIMRYPLWGDDYVKNPMILFFHGITVVAHCVSYIIIFISAHYMLNTLKVQQGTMSSETFLANEVLVHAVFVEAVLPLMFSAPVAANAILTTFYENSLQWQEYLPTYFVCFIPLLSPIISIGFIKPYRETMKNIVTFKFAQKEPKKPDDDQTEEERKAIADILDISH